MSARRGVQTQCLVLRIVLRMGVKVSTVCQKQS